MTTPTTTRSTCTRCGAPAIHIAGRGWEHDLVPGPACHGPRPTIGGHPPTDGPMVPGGADPAELCERHRINGHTCLWSVAQQGGGWLCDGCTEQLQHMNTAAGVDR